MEEKYNWKCNICGWKMWIDPQYEVTKETPINCGKCGSIYIGKE